MFAEPRKHHLTDLEFSDLLFGEQPEAGVAEHLAQCDHCRQEFEAVGGSLSSFRQLSSVWAQAEAPATITVPSRWAQRLVSVPSWGTGLAVTTATGILAFAMTFTSNHTSAAHMAASVAPAPKADLAADNRLMVSIDEELSYKTPVAASHADARHRPGDLNHTATADSVLD